MKLVKILTIATGANARSIFQWFQNYDNDYDLPTTTTGDYATEGWTTTASTTTEELTTTLEPWSTLTTTTDGEYAPPDITTTTIASTELTSTTNTPSSDLGPVITVDVIDCADKDKNEDPLDEPVGGWWSAAWSYLPCYITGC